MALSWSSSFRAIWPPNKAASLEWNNLRGKLRPQQEHQGAGGLPLSDHGFSVVPLPSDWAKNVKSAAPHVMSVAQYRGREVYEQFEIEPSSIAPAAADGTASAAPLSEGRDFITCQFAITVSWPRS